MALYSYKKVIVEKNISREQNAFPLIFNKMPKEQLTVGKVLSGLKHDFQDMLTTSKLASLAIPLILITTGGLLLYNQITPEIDQRLKEVSGYYEQGNVTLVEGEFLSAREQYLSNPGSQYFQHLTQEALEANVIKEDPVSNNYQGIFYLTIESLEFDKLAVTANVESGIEEVYKSVLQTTLAHFKGTGLPISDVQNNIVIYGHSAAGDYYKRTGDKVAAFSLLRKVRMGDEIIIHMDETTYKYKVSSTGIIEPDDTRIINGKVNQKTLTLFTCYPDGSNGKRFMVVAKPFEE
ncbi:sortase [Candidatus Dojkabacteria bacterium]|nr:sortase [Candidatus Dojkabacteria bacterium]